MALIAAERRRASELVMPTHGEGDGSASSFLRALSRALRERSAPADVLATASMALTARLGLLRTIWVEAEGDRTFAVPHDSAAAGPRGPIQQPDAAVPFLDRLAAGQTVAIEGASRGALAPLLGSDFHATVAVPVIANNRLLAVLFALRDQPRAWTEHDLALLGDAADRMWEALDRARCQARAVAHDTVFAAFMAHAPFGMHLKDAGGHYLRVNPEGAAAIGLPIDDILGRHSAELFAEATAERIAAMDASAGAGIAVSEEFATGLRDRYASVLSISFPVEGGDRAATGGFTLDLTQRKEAEAALERSRDALYQSEKLSALGSMLAGVSHELNNPLSIVVAQAVMMERQSAGTQLAERAFKIRKAADRCARIVQTFLAMARQKTPERTAVDLNVVADGAVELATYGLRSDGVGITRAFAAELPRISADGDQLHQIVTNLIVNAQQAMASERSLRWLEVRTALGPEPCTVILEVADSGPGIAADMRRRIFEPFYTTKPQGEGTGVGLSFSQGVAEAHGGRLTLVPSERGATFRLTLPIDERQTLPRVEPVPPSAAPAMARRALIVDDEEEIASSLADILSIEGYDCEVVVGGAAAQARLAQGQPYDLVVSDLRMPDVDGPTLYAWVVDRRPDLAACMGFTTGDTLGTAAARFIADAGRPVLEKPFMPDSIRYFLAEMAGQA